MTGPAGIILIADDYAMTAGISDAIVQLGKDGRLSGTGAMVNMPSWPETAANLQALRSGFAIGLHLNLTQGKPLGPMPRLAPDDVLPGVATVIGRAMSRALDLDEIEQEVDRQLARFDDEAGHPPDFVDGHQHVHGLPGIRDRLRAALRRRYGDRPILIRDPADGLGAILTRRASAAKAMIVALLAAGSGAQARSEGFITNDSFAGYSSFGPAPYDEEFATYLHAAGDRHLVMCHPGHVADGEAEGDEIAHRRPEEFAFLAAHTTLPDLLWRPDRSGATDRPAFTAGDAS